MLKARWRPASRRPMTHSGPGSHSKSAALHRTTPLRGKAAAANAIRHRGAATVSTPARRSQHRLAKPHGKLWYALHIGAAPADLTQAAMQCTGITDYISLVPPDTLLLEIGGSLRYFGGVRNIRQRLHETLQARVRHEVISPSPAASLLLVGQQVSGLISHAEQLRAALGRLPVACLPLERRTLQSLQRCGLMTLQDLWRLPPAELRLRFGRPLYDYLNQLKGERVQQPSRWQPPPIFEEEEEFDYPLTTTGQISIILQPVLARLEAFLKRRHLQTDMLNLTLFQERGCADADEPASLALQIGTRLPASRASVFALLLETRLSQIHLTSPVRALKILVDRYQPFVPGGGVPGAQGSRAASEQTLPDLLAARLGAECIQGFELTATHAPELASGLTSYRQATLRQRVFTPLPGGLDDTLPPAWLLNPPRRLALRNQRLFYQSFLELVRGPHRIESLWWTGQPLRRDYYVAHNEQGMRLWIYRDLRDADLAESRRWYLHGLFG